MDDELTSAMINRAWDKIAAAPHSHRDDAEVLRTFISSEQDTSSALSRLASRVSSPRERRLLVCASMDAARRRKLLQAEYFILTGDTFAPPAPVRECVPPLASLRALLARAREAADLYRAASYASDAPLADTFARLAAEQNSLAAALRQMIYTIF